jgi:murein DD-endopeptidase MepM/ murein hydrolase activator NlpD
MSGFTIELSTPFPSGFTGGLGGPQQGGHQPPQWYIEYGMDLGADDGTDVYATFDGHITRMSPHVPSDDTGRVYGAQLFVRAHNDMMGGFYTHITDVPPELTVGSTVSRGDWLGRVFSFDGIPAHLHLALVEIVGGLPGGSYQGVDLYGHFVDSANNDSVASVAFAQDGTPPVVGG